MAEDLQVIPRDHVVQSCLWVVAGLEESPEAIHRPFGSMIVAPGRKAVIGLFKRFLLKFIYKSGGYAAELGYFVFQIISQKRRIG
jgi:hypothetical protein